MNVLLLGGGGREHALAWRLVQSPSVDRLHAAPGNPGIEEEGALCHPLDVSDHAAVVGFCERQSIGLVVIGPEAPLVDGLADSLRGVGVPVFGPSKAAAQLEGSKGFTKELCAANDIPTAAFRRFHDKDAALDVLDRDFGLPVVVKADGLAAGKGVTVAFTHAEATDAVEHILAGELGASVVIEAFLEGEEASLFALTDGETIVPFGSAQDHKRVGEGDTGPNTGGMGAYSPARVLTPELEARALREIVAPTVRALADAGTPYSGVLYAGLMLTDTGPQLIEYNCRFGDPEAQVLMMRYEGDLAQLMLAVAEGRLAKAETPSFSDEVALTVVMAARGYPGVPAKGGAIGGLERAAERGAKVFHAGTALAGGQLVAAGGRVLTVAACGVTVGEARETAYAAVREIDFPTGFSRSDIGWREVAREQA